MPKPRITIVGLGRIGGSIGLALKKSKADLEIVGHDKEPRAMQLAQKRGAVDRTHWNLLSASDGAGLIVLALPLGEIQSTLKHLSRELPPGVILTDTAASKAPVLEWAKVLPRDVNFIGGHPIISPRYSPPVTANAPASGPINQPLTGIDAADPDLFTNAIYCLTPTPAVEPEAVDVSASFVSMLGAKPLFLDAAEHDGLMAGAEHLAYILSATLLHATSTSSGWRELSKFAGRAYLDATELAARDPVSQRMVMLGQPDDLTRWIDASIETLRELRRAIAQGDANALDALFQRMNDARKEWLRGDVGAHAAVDISEVQGGPMRLLLGGLSTRGGRRK